MCGIIAVISNNDDAPSKVIDGLRRLEYRGYDSWGVAIDTDSGLAAHRGVGKLESSKNQLDQLSLLKTSIALGHTRWATHGPPTEVNAHPHLSCGGEVAIVHNGIVENHHELREELKACGHAFRSETDSEVIAHLVEEELKSGQGLAEAVNRAVNRVKGTFAVVVIEVSSRRLVAARRDSPLVIGISPDCHFLASDVPAFLPSTNQVIFLGNDEIIETDGQNLTRKSLVSNEVLSIKPTRVSWTLKEAAKGEFAHYTLKEIHEQSSALRSTVSRPAEEIESAVNLIKEAYGVFFVAAGSAFHAGLSGTYLFSQLAKRHVNIALASEFPSFAPFLTKRTLLVAISQSGETADTLEAVKAAKRAGSKVLAIVNVQGSSLNREADTSLLLQAGPEVGVLATKSLTAQIALIELLAHAVAGKYQAGVAKIKEAAKAIEQFLASSELARIQQLAQEIGNSEHLFVIGRSLNFPTALEAALKIKEVSYLHAEGLAGGELKHGLIALIESGTPVIAYVPNDETRPEILTNCAEVKARGAKVVGISPFDDPVFDFWVKIADLPTETPIIGAVPAQLLGYELALAKGLDPDKPRNLAKSVTVK